MPHTAILVDQFGGGGGVWGVHVGRWRGKGLRHASMTDAGYLDRTLFSLNDNVYVGECSYVCGLSSSFSLNLMDWRCLMS